MQAPTPPAGVEQFYPPPGWRVTIKVGDAVLVQLYPLQGHHLAAAAGQLLMLYTGQGDYAFGMLDPQNRAPITVTIEPL